ncbi:transmembrane protein 18 [Galendromus occidentalis]|uniref:Transmembrane protein 18 n=1 Tax=Galendromus occidentalis TaxID=34638 RepID=A0AAJ6QWV1_9ACAR|nr:transmembrane protein 18 [Galendromus occidentalis]
MAAREHFEDPHFEEVVPTEFSMGLIISKVDFREPWIIGLVAFHCTMLFLSVTTRSRNNVQMILFSIMLALVYFSATVNEWAALNWNKFSKYQYFDSNGFFISTVFSVPLLLNCLFMIGQWLYQARDLMVDLRKVQLKKRRRDQHPINYREQYDGKASKDA